MEAARAPDPTDLGDAMRGASASHVFAVRLRELRAKADLSQEELAHQAGVNRAYLSDLERGRREPGIQILLKLAQALSVDPGALLRGATPIVNPPKRRKRKPRLSPAERLGAQVARLAESADDDARKRFLKIARAFFPRQTKVNEP